MRIVIDTNVFVSAALSAKASPALALRLTESRCVLLKSEATEAELRRVLARPKIASLIAPSYLEWLAEQLAKAEQVDIVERVTECRDPKDNKFLELAVNGHADMIVSGDLDLLILEAIGEIPIVNPATFVRLMTR